MSNTSKLNVNFYRFKYQPHKMVKHTQTIFRQLPTNCFYVFDHFKEFVLKFLNKWERS